MLYTTDRQVEVVKHLWLEVNSFKRQMDGSTPAQQIWRVPGGNQIVLHSAELRRFHPTGRALLLRLF